MLTCQLCGAEVPESADSCRNCQQMRLPRSPLALTLVITLVLSICALGWSLVAHIHRVGIDSKITRDPYDVPYATAHHADQLVQAASVAVSIIALVITVLRIAWMYRGARRIHDRRADGAEYAPYWAIVGWLIPFFNLVRPRQVIGDLYRSSSPYGRWAAQTPWWISLWWALVLVNLFLSLVSGTTTGTTAADLHGHDIFLIVIRAMQMMAAGLEIAVVITLQARISAIPLPPAPSEPPAHLRFNPAPGWPQPPAGWHPMPGWQPDPTWPPAPAGWSFWV